MTDGLNVPEPMGVGTMAVGVQQQQRIHDQWSTFVKMEQELSSWGFDPFTKPQCNYPTITTELLTGPDTHRYTEVYDQVTEWLSYTTNVLARLKARLLEVTNEMNYVALEVKQAAIAAARAAREKKPAKDTLDDLYRLHPRWVQLQLEKQWLEQEKGSVESHAAKQERDYKRMSRQIELRKEEYGARQQGGAMGYRGAPASPGMYPSR